MIRNLFHLLALWRWFIIANFDFAKHGQVFLPIYVKPLSGTVMLPLDFKVDTGADTTTVSKADLKHFGYDMDWIDKTS